MSNSHAEDCYQRKALRGDLGQHGSDGYETPERPGSGSGRIRRRDRAGGADHRGICGYRAWRPDRRRAYGTRWRNPRRVTLAYSSESGQAAPLYIVMVASLLFLALAFFAVGQAGATRNSAQSAADAAALAAAQESRRSVPASSWGTSLTRTSWTTSSTVTQWVRGGCEARPALLPRMRPTGWPMRCEPGAADGVSPFTLSPKQTVGDSILPGTEGEYGQAQATAIVETPMQLRRRARRRHLRPPRAMRGISSPEEGDAPQVASPGLLDCEDSAPWEIDPEHPVIFRIWPTYSLSDWPRTDRERTQRGGTMNMRHGTRARRVAGWPSRP